MKDKKKKDAITITTEEGTCASMNLEFDEKYLPSEENIAKELKKIKNIKEDDYV